MEQSILESLGAWKACMPGSEGAVGNVIPTVAVDNTRRPPTSSFSSGAHREAGCPAALIFKRNAVRSQKLSEQDWTEAEKQLLRELWPAANKLDIHKAFSTKSGVAVLARAKVLGIWHNIQYPAKRSDIHRALCYNDWAGACTTLEVDPDSEEGQQVLRMLNYYARTTAKKQMASGGCCRSCK